MNLVGILLLSAACVVVLSASRRMAVIGILFAVLFLTQGQQAQVFGFNFFAIRIVELIAFLRVLLRKEFVYSSTHLLDRSILWLYGFTTIVFLIRSNEGAAYQIGAALDALLCYFVFRGLLTDIDDFRWVLCAFVALLLPFVAIVLWESTTNHNLFSGLGGVSDGAAWFRGTRIRATGSFRHASLLGTLGATFAPLYIALWLDKRTRKFGMVGLVLCALIVWASNSGGPLNSLFFGILGWLLWGQRSRMKLVRRTVLAGVVVLALVMKAPIWYLPAKVSSLTGGDGWHRSYLIEMAANHFREWALSGMPIKATGSWFPYTLESTGGADMTNQFLSFGMAAGVFAMALFISQLVRAFSLVGQTGHRWRQFGAEFQQNQFLVWGVGCTLAAHTANWLGITYFDQTYVLWFFHLASVACISNILTARRSVGQTSVNEPSSVEYPITSSQC